ncbi:MAG: DUF2937 family protein [Roseobacter sp.]
MVLRIIVLAAGIAGAMSAAQFPAFSQQYYQRLGGAVDALEHVVDDFDASATALGLTRTQALEQLQGTEFLQTRQRDMQTAFKRYATLRHDLEVLEGLGPFMRAYRAPHLTDREIARGTWAAFQPALPLSFASALFAAIGFACGAGLMRCTRRLLPGARRKSSLPA